MRNFLAFVGAAILVLLGLGWYLGWYSITPEKVGQGQTRLQVDINQDKAGKDVQQGLQKGADKVKEIIDKNGQNKPADPNVPDSGPLPPPPASGNTTTQPATPANGAQDATRNII